MNCLKAAVNMVEAALNVRAERSVGVGEGRVVFREELQTTREMCEWTAPQGRGYGGTSLIINCHPPWGHQKALCLVLL